MKAYISTPIRKENDSRHVQRALEGVGILVNNPCDVDSVHGDPADIPKRVRDQCIAMMDSSDIGILLLDYFGHDCAFEAGYLNAAEKPVYGVYVDRANASGESLRNLRQHQHGITRVFNSIDEMIKFLRK